MDKKARADVTPVRQRSQYTCMSTSMMMCLRALGLDLDEDTVNKVMGAQPMRGASWEQAIACAQYFGMRAHLICPATVRQVKEFTDQGTPVMIAWNPEGRDWSHASVVFDVTDAGDGLVVHVADPNIPNPDKTVREVPEDEFYGKWAEKWPDYMVRRPAMAIEREISTDGRQMVASKTARPSRRTVDMWNRNKRNRRKTTGEQLRNKCMYLPNLNEPQLVKAMIEEFPGYTEQSIKETVHLVVIQREMYKVQKILVDLFHLQGSDKALSELVKSYPGHHKAHVDIQRDYVTNQVISNGVEAWKEILAQTDNAKAKALLKQLIKEAPRLPKNTTDIDYFHINLKPKRTAPPVESETPAVRTPTPKKQAPTPDKPIVDSGVSQKVDILRTLADKLKNWPEGLAHVESVIAEYDAGGKPSQNDLKKIRNFLYRNKMRDEANHFRTARTIKDFEGRVWGPKRGLEGPIPIRGRKVLYYDPREKGGSYYDPTTDMYLDHDQAFKIMQGRVADKYGKLIDRVYVVRNPSPDSSFGDITFSIRPIDIANIVIGTGAQRWKHEKTTFHTDENSATKDAMERLTRLHGREIPAWVTDNNPRPTIQRMSYKANMKTQAGEGAVLEQQGMRLFVNNEFLVALKANPKWRGNILDRGARGMTLVTSDESEGDFYFHQDSKRPGWFQVMFSSRGAHVLINIAKKDLRAKVRKGSVGVVAAAYLNAHRASGDEDQIIRDVNLIDPEKRYIIWDWNKSTLEWVLDRGYNGAFFQGPTNKRILKDKRFAVVEEGGNPNPPGHWSRKYGSMTTKVVSRWLVESDK